MNALTEKQAEALCWIRAYTEAHEVAPTEREIAKAFGITVQAVFCRLEGLRRKGFLVPVTSARGIARGTILTALASTIAQVPIPAVPEAETLPPCDWSTLTKRQREIVGFIRERVTETGIAPEHRDIMARFGFASTYTVHCHLRALEKRGAILCGRRRNRAIRIAAEVTS